MAKSSKWKYLSSNLNLKVNIKGELKRIYRESILKEYISIFFFLLAKHCAIDFNVNSFAIDF